MNIVELVDQLGLHPKRSGKEFVIRCPFHDDNKPSLYLEPINNLFYCFGCGKSGNLVEFYKLYTGLSYEDAIVELNKKFNLNLHPNGSNDKLRDFILECHNNIWNSIEALKYLKYRKIDQQTIIDYKIGWVSSFDKYKNAIVLPMINRWGRFDGFTLKPLSGNSKYIHANLGKKFYKRSVIFTDSLIRDNYYIVEGQFDALTLHQMGINSIATLGFMSDEQAELISNIAKEAVLVPDNDTTGINLAVRSFIKLVNNGILPQFALVNTLYKDVNEAYMAGEKNIITKPINLTQFITTVQKLFSNDIFWATKTAKVILEEVNITNIQQKLYQDFCAAGLINKMPHKKFVPTKTNTNLEIEAVVAVGKEWLSQNDYSFLSTETQKFISDLLSDQIDPSVTIRHIFTMEEARHYLELKKLAKQDPIYKQQLHKLEWELQKR